MPDTADQFLERSKRLADPQEVQFAQCKCDPSSGCGDNCINRIMGYICGKACPCGEYCTNKSLSRRKGKSTKVVWVGVLALVLPLIAQTGSRGFGLVATEDIDEGAFVIDYRGEVIDLECVCDLRHDTDPQHIHGPHRERVQEQEELLRHGLRPRGGARCCESSIPPR